MNAPVVKMAQIRNMAESRRCGLKRPLAEVNTCARIPANAYVFQTFIAIAIAPVVPAHPKPIRRVWLFGSADPTHSPRGILVYWQGG